MEKTYYYATRQNASGFIGIVYHYDETGNKEVIIFRSPNSDTEGDALDAAAIWAVDNCIDVFLE